jgi:molybdate transport system regulatory protein
MAKLSIRVDFDSGSLGPGKVRLLEFIADTGSIRKAAAGMKMSYRKAWLLLQALEETFGAPLADTATGGKDGGGACLTPLGKLVAARYRLLEKAAGLAAAAHIALLSKKAAGRNSRVKKNKPLK